MKFNLKNSIFIILGIALFSIFGLFNFKNLLRKIVLTENQPIIAGGVVPHHLLAKEIIQKFFEDIFSNEKPETVILLSPDHFNNKTLCKEGSFITVELNTETFEKIKVDNFLLKNLQEKIEFCFNNSFIAQEHGITNLLPYIEKYSPQTKILPILVPSNTSKEKIASLIEAINSQSPQKTIVIASVDFSHYLPKDVAEFHDRKSIRVVLNFEEENFQNLDVDCWQCLYGARLFAKLKNKKKAKIIDYKNSAEFLNGENISETTSYFSVIFEKGSSEAKENVRTLMFVGDIMLDRGVEYLMKKKSIFYPFEKVEQFLRGIDFVIGNLEGPIAENPPSFSAESLKFAFSSDIVEALSFSHFNILSLANNHTFDLGQKGYEETEKILKESKIDFLGHPIECNENFLLERDNIIFLAFNKTFPFNCSDEEIVEIVKRVKTSNSEKFLVVMFHWGNEYQLKSSLSQQKLAHQMIDAGADLIVGSHPHVVQEIEEYKGKLIFYSLGNFIFDQYFSKETQEGLAVGLEVWPEKIVYRLFPLKSQLSQPSLMNSEEAKNFLEKLAQKSSPKLLNEIKNGKIEIEK